MRYPFRNAAPAERVERTPSVPWVLASLALCVLLPSLGTSVANVALPTLAATFDASFQEVQWVVLAYLLATTTLVVGVGRLGDVTGHRRLLMAGIATFTVASWLCAIAPGLWFLIAARAVQGAGAAVMMALAMALVGETVPKQRTGRAIGLLGTMSAAGTALGPSLGGVLIARFGWQAIFFVSLALGVLAFALAQRHLPADRPRANAEPAGFDGRGTLLLALALAAYALAMTAGSGRFGLVNLALLVVAALGVRLFVSAQARAVSPLIRWSIVRDPALVAGLVMSALVSTVMMTTLVVGPFHLAQALGLEPALVGIVMSVGPAIAVLAGVPAGRIVDRFGAQRMTALALAGMLAGCSALIVAPTALGIAGYAIPIALLTAAYALFQVANNTAVLMDLALDRRGAVSGLLSLSRNLGLVTGASVMGALFSFAAHAADFTRALPQAVALGTRVTFAVAAALVVVAMVIALRNAAPVQPAQPAT